MIRVYRMWRFVKILERYCIGKRIHPKRKNVTDIDCGKDFMKLKTLLRRRNYTPHESIVAYSMAIDYGYILNDRGLIGDGEHELSMTGDGLAFATPSGLLNAMAKSIGQLSAWVSVVLSIIAVAVSFYTLQQKPTPPKVIVEQQPQPQLVEVCGSQVQIVAKIKPCPTPLAK